MTELSDLSVHQRHREARYPATMRPDTKLYDLVVRIIHIALVESRGGKPWRDIQHLQRHGGHRIASTLVGDHLRIKIHFPTGPGSAYGRHETLTTE